MAADWRNLSGDLIDTLGLELSADLCDLVRFAAVCRPWQDRLVSRNWLGRYALPVQTLRHLPSLRLPKLMLPKKLDAHVNEDFIDWGTRQMFHVDMGAAQMMRFVGSGHGWLVTVLNNKLYGLYNPITREMQLLPGDGRFDALSYVTDVSKAIIIRTSPMSGLEWRVAAIVKGMLFWVRPGIDQAWTLASGPYTFTDVAHSGDFLLIATNNLSRVEAWSMTLKRRVWSSAVRSPIPGYFWGKHVWFVSYLVEVRCRIIGVSRPASIVERGSDGSMLFFELVNGEWHKITHLGDCCLFLGDKTSMALSPVPTNTRFQRNCVYFTRCRFPSMEEDYFDWSVYRLDNRTYEPFYFPDSAKYIRDSSPLWVTFTPSTELAFN